MNKIDFLIIMQATAVSQGSGELLSLYLSVENSYLCIYRWRTYSCIYGIRLMHLQTPTGFPPAQMVGSLGVAYKMSQRQPGVQQVFRLKQNPAKNTLPLIFLVTPKRGAEPVYIQYDDFKRELPQLLFEYFEKKLSIGPVREDSSCRTPDPRDRQEREKEATREELSARGQRQRAQREKEREREAMKLSRERETRPVRSCRRKDGYNKQKDDYDFREEPPLPPPPQPLPPLTPEQSVSPQVSSSSESMDSCQNFKRKSFRKILDYDQMIEQQSVFNLISPAVIPACKGKGDKAQINPGSYYPPLPPLHPLKEAEREFSSEGFKDSEESEFLLDDRGGKERRRKERFQQREQERSMRRKRTKKIKKKSASGK